MQALTRAGEDFPAVVELWGWQTAILAVQLEYAQKATDDQALTPSPDFLAATKASQALTCLFEAIITARAPVPDVHLTKDAIAKATDLLIAASADAMEASATQPGRPKGP